MLSNRVIKLVVFNRVFLYVSIGTRIFLAFSFTDDVIIIRAYDAQVPSPRQLPQNTRQLWRGRGLQITPTYEHFYVDE